MKIEPNEAVPELTQVLIHQSLAILAGAVVAVTTGIEGGDVAQANAAMFGRLREATNRVFGNRSEKDANVGDIKLILKATLNILIEELQKSE